MNIDRTRAFYCRFGIAAAFSILVGVGKLPAVDPVQSTMVNPRAWIGEAVLFRVELFSPGPFSGTASFDLPEIPKTVILKSGRAVVGSESIQGNTWFKQTHEFFLYTQQSGTITVPAFQVQFFGKETFTSDPQKREGKTKAMDFESVRPPVNTSEELVISVREIQIEQIWNPEVTDNLLPGDIVSRTVIRRVAGTTGMMLPALRTNEMEGVRIYPGKPSIQDNSERGETTAVRTDTVKYQFEVAGQFEIPSIEFNWWNPEQEREERKVLKGQTVLIRSPAIEAANKASQQNTLEPSETSSRWWGGIVRGVILTGAIVIPMFSYFWFQRKPTETIVANDLRVACRQGDAGSAYLAILRWQQLTSSFREPTSVVENKLQECQQQLSRQLFDKQNLASDWDAQAFEHAFQVARLERLKRKQAKANTPALPDLNPIHAGSKAST